MNVFHNYSEIQQIFENEENKKEYTKLNLELQGRQLLTSSINCSYIAEMENIDEKQDFQIGGLAIKLSILNRGGILITDILSHFGGKIVIDAEHERLDLWLGELIEAGTIHKRDLDRLYITIQVKRDDAIDQVARLDELGVKVVLVSGNKAYLSENENKKIASDCFAMILDKYDNIAYLGVSQRLFAIINRKLENKMDYDNSRILELHGYQQLEQSSLWVNYTGKQLSDEAQAYISRRKMDHDKTFDDYIARSYDGLAELADNHELIVFIDFKCAYQYFSQLRIFNHLRVNKAYK